MSEPIRRGSVIWAEAGPTVGVGQSGRRPFVVVSSAGYLGIVTRLVIAIPVSKTARGWLNHVQLRGETGLGDVPSFAMTEQIRAIARERIVKNAGTVSDECLGEIDQWLRDFLDLPAFV